jgi:hypothetical protein
MAKDVNVAPEWEEEESSPRILDLTKKQADFEKKKARGEFETEVKEPKESKILTWIILGLVAIGLILLLFLFDLI